MSRDYFIEDLRSSSEDEESGHSGYLTRDRASQNDSPPAILAFSITSGQGRHGDSSPESSPSCHMDDADDEGQGENSDWSVEEWMILDHETHEEDSTIQLNLSFSISSSAEDSDTDSEDDKKTLLQDTWSVSKRDKESVQVLSKSRYFVPDQTSFCPICKKMGHLARNCQMQKKCLVCVLCGIQGHLQKDCPRQVCSRCGLLAHGIIACLRAPVWHQHCQRCGMMGHLSDTCPDNWRQFHHTIKMTEVPIISRTDRTKKQKKRPVYCYNCSKRGHHGYECFHKRMISGTFLTLPYVCHYDTMEAHHIISTTRNKTTEIANKTEQLPEEQRCLKSCEADKDELLRKRSKTKPRAQLCLRKTWPERRRERQEVKRLRREAQARREGGVLGQYRHKPDDDSSYFDHFGVSVPRQHTSLSKKVKKIISRHPKSRDTEPWKMRRRKKHGSLYPQRDMDIDAENLHSSKERVRHRRR